MVRWARRFGVALLIALALGTTSPPAAAQQAGPDVSAAISSDRVEVGEPFTVELRALSDSGQAATDPQLYVPGGFDASGPSVTNRMVTRFGGGRSVVKQGIGATWQLVGRRPGTYTIPAPTVLMGGQRVTAGRTMRVTVVPASARRRQPPGRSGQPAPSPFGRPGRGTAFPFPFRFDFDDLFDDPLKRRPSLSRTGEQLTMAEEPDRYVFLRAMVDKTRVVVGEQVTLSLYVYYRADFEMRDRHEAPLADFLRVPLLTSPGADPPVRTRVGGHGYLARLLDRVAIFPLRAGSLHTGSLTSRFSGRRVGKRVLRKSNDIVIEAREPPTEGRPPGYRVGDVGRFRLSATVKPQEIEAGGSVAVLVRLQGKGSLPHSLEVPERTGIDWLDPEKKGEVTTDDDRVGGWRSFGYVVRIDEPGDRYLGRIELPYYDAARQSYEVAQADLGNVKVLGTPSKQGRKTDGGEDDEDRDPQGDPFASIGPVRLSLRAVESSSAGGLEPRTFWGLVLVPPLAVAVAGGLRRGRRRLARRRAARQSDAGSLAERALGEVKRARSPQDRATAAERALHLGIEAATGLKSRGILLDELSGQLEQHGLSPEQSVEIQQALATCSTLRFEPDPPEDLAAKLPRQITKLVRALVRAGARRHGGAPAGAKPSTPSDEASDELAPRGRAARRRPLASHPPGERGDAR